MFHDCGLKPAIGHRLFCIIGQGHDDVEIGSHQFIHRVGSVDRHIDTDFFHHLVDKVVDLARAYAGRAGNEASGEMFAGQRRGNGRAHRIHRTHEKNRRQLAFLLGHPRCIGLYSADQCEKPAGGFEIHHQLVVEPLDQKFGGLIVQAAPAISTASIWKVDAERIAS